MYSIKWGLSSFLKDKDSPVILAAVSSILFYFFLHAAFEAVGPACSRKEGVLHSSAASNVKVSNSPT